MDELINLKTDMEYFLEEAKKQLFNEMENIRKEVIETRSGYKNLSSINSNSYNQSGSEDIKESFDMLELLGLQRSDRKLHTELNFKPNCYFDYILLNSKAEQLLDILEKLVLTCVQGALASYAITSMKIREIEHISEKSKNILNEYIEIDLVYTLDQIVDRFYVSKQIKSGRLDCKEILQEKRKLKSSLKRSLRFYEKNMIIPSRYINKYGKCLFDNPKDEINILGLKIFVDMELSIRGTIPLEFSDRELSLIEKYRIYDQKYELHSVVRLMMFLSNKIREMEERDSKRKNVLDEILKLDEFSEKPSTGKQKRFCYKFEDTHGMTNGDISLTKLKLLLSYFK